MILVTVGTHNEPFNRLIVAADELAAKAEERILVQRGVSTYEPQHAKSFRFTSYRGMEEFTRKARVIVMHAAAGAILLAISLNKPIVVIPRLQRHGEVVDDHQLQLASVLEAEGRVIQVMMPTAATLQDAIQRATTLTILKSQIAGASQLVGAIQRQLDRWQRADHG